MEWRRRWWRRSIGSKSVILCNLQRKWEPMCTKRSKRHVWSMDVLCWAALAQASQTRRLQERVRLSTLIELTITSFSEFKYCSITTWTVEIDCLHLNCESVIEDKSISRSNMDDPETDAGIAVKAIVSVANGPSFSKQELEKRRVFVPGVLYHIRRQKMKREERVTALPAPAKPYDPETDPPRGSKYKHYVICGTDPSSRFSRIILSRTLLSDHGCFNIRDGILDAMQWKKWWVHAIVVILWITTAAQLHEYGSLNLFVI